MSMRVGLDSVTFRQEQPAGVLAAALKAELGGIEWGSDPHVPVGDLEGARRVRSMTAEAGLRVEGYLSPYRIGQSAGEGMRFETVAETAAELGAPLVRVWAGSRASREVFPVYRKQIADEALKIAGVAEARGVRVALECLPATLMDAWGSAVDLMGRLAHPGLGVLWQPLPGMDGASQLEGLRALGGRVLAARVCWWGPLKERLPLARGEEDWRGFVRALGEAGRDVALMLAPAVGERREEFLAEAKMVRGWVADAGAGGTR